MAIRGPKGRRWLAAAGALTALGQPPETKWPYDPSRDHFAATYKPPAAASAAAGLHSIARGICLLPTVDDLLSTLDAAEPPLLVVDLYDPWHSVQGDGRIAMPQPGMPLLGGHAVLVVGYQGQATDPAGYFIVHNSWGPAWGDQGYGYLPYRYVESFGRDAWVLVK